MGLAAFAALLAAGLLAVSFMVGTVASAAAPAEIGPPPEDLPVEPVTINSPSGSALSGWYAPGRPGGGAVALLHGVRANRMQMLPRARLLHRWGFSVLLFDFQAEGESPGKNVTFGWLESMDARAAHQWLKEKAPGERIGLLGVSLGGAAAVVSDPVIEADAMVLEAVYGDFNQAIRNRLVIRLGALGEYFEPALRPLLSWQVKPRLGFDPAVLSPASRIARIRAPVLLVAGDRDRLATIAEMRQIFANANEPKQLWIVPGAGHQDFLLSAPVDYERRVVGFLLKTLRRGKR
jgi:pimeloyl-ACP methyl ester carboxylesterase